MYFPLLRQDDYPEQGNPALLQEPGEENNDGGPGQKLTGLQVDLGPIEGIAQGEGCLADDFGGNAGLDPHADG